MGAYGGGGGGGGVLSTMWKPPFFISRSFGYFWLRRICVRFKISNVKLMIPKLESRKWTREPSNCLEENPTPSPVKISVFSIIAPPPLSESPIIVIIPQGGRGSNFGGGGGV